MEAVRAPCTGADGRLTAKAGKHRPSEGDLRGFVLCSKHLPCDAFLVMDADGEDRVEDAARLIELAMSQRTAVFFAERRKRFKGIVFKIGYHLYRAVHWILTGVPVRVGNS